MTSVARRQPFEAFYQQNARIADFTLALFEQLEALGKIIFVLFGVRETRTARFGFADATALR